MIEQQIEQSFIDKLTGLKYEYRSDITDRAALEKNFREKFEALNRVKLTEAEFARLLDEIVTPDVFSAAKTLRSIMEKTASFFGHADISFCLKVLENEEDLALYNRALHLLSHGKYAIHEPTEMGEDNKDLFRRILRDFTAQFQFALPEILEGKTPT